MSFLRESGAVLFYRLVLVAVILLTEVLLARVLGPAGRGYVAIFTITPVLIAVVAGCGLDYALNYFGHLDNGSVGSTFRRALGAGLAVALGSSALLATDPGGVLSQLYSGVPEAYGTVERISLALVPAEVFFALSSMLAMTVGRPVLYGKMRLLRRSGALVAVVVAALLLSRNVRLAIVLVIAGQIAATALAGGVPLVIPRKGSNPRRPQPPSRRIGYGALLRYGFRSLPARLAERLQSRIDIVLLGLLSTGSVVGVYSVAAGLAETLFYVSGSLSAVLFARSAEQESEIHVLTLRVMIPFGIGAALILGGSATLLVPLVFGQAFAHAVTLLWILLPGTIAFSLVQITSPYFVQRGLSGVVSLANGIGVICNIALNLVLIPKFHGVGAAIASAVSYGVTGAWVIFRMASVEGGPPERVLVVKRSDLLRVWRAVRREAVRWKEQ